MLVFLAFDGVCLFVCGTRSSLGRGEYGIKNGRGDVIELSGFVRIGISHVNIIAWIEQCDTVEVQRFVYIGRTNKTT
jgi:hypothetical protein